MRKGLIGSAVIFACVVCSVSWVIGSHGKMVTAVPLWMQIAILAAFWAFVLAAVFTGYILYLLMKKLRG